MNRTARDIMSSQVVSVPSSVTLVELERVLYDARISGAPVVDGGTIVGVVSRRDIDRFVSRERSREAAASAFYATDPQMADDELPRGDPTHDAFELLEKTRVREIMTRDVLAVEADAPIREIARLMTDQRIHRVLVVEKGALAGVVSSLDLVAVLAEG